MNGTVTLKDVQLKIECQGMETYHVITIIVYAFLCPLCVRLDEQTKGRFNLFFGSWGCKCGVPNRNARILGGEALKINEFPWLASLHIKDSQSIHGTLINDKYILTSASLLIGLTPYDVKVTLGSSDRCSTDVSSTKYSVISILLHPEYSPTDRVHDISLVKLNGKVNYEKSTICLESPGKSYVGQVGIVVGWQEPNPGEMGFYCRMRKMGLPILGQKECLNTLSNKRYYTLDKGCVGVVGATSGVCDVDAGSPVMYRDYNGVYELIGILSDKNVCGNGPSTAMYTKIYQHIQWIKDVTQDGNFCSKF